MVWGEKLVRKLLAGKRQIQMKIQILALVHRLDNGVKGGKSGLGKYWQEKQQKRPSW